MSEGIVSMTAEEYHADPCEVPSLSASLACLIATRTPLHAWTAHPKLNPDFAPRESEKFDIGRVAHTLLLEQREVAEAVEVIAANSWRTKAAQEARADARANGKTPLLAAHVENVVAMLKQTRAQLDAIDVDPPLFTDGLAEQALIWQEDGVTCRALCDWIRNDLTTIDDFKTTSASADPDRWTRQLFQIGADVQTAFYLRGLRAVTGAEAELRYVVQEVYPPYALSVISLGPDVLAVGEAKVEYALSRWRDCLATDQWPGYATQVAYAELPAYEETRWLEKTTREAQAA